MEQGWRDFRGGRGAGVAVPHDRAGRLLALRTVHNSELRVLRRCDEQRVTSAWAVMALVPLLVCAFARVVHVVVLGRQKRK